MPLSSRKAVASSASVSCLAILWKSKFGACEMILRRGRTRFSVEASRGGCEPCSVSNHAWSFSPEYMVCGVSRSSRSTELLSQILAVMASSEMRKGLSIIDTVSQVIKCVGSLVSVIASTRIMGARMSTNSRHDPRQSGPSCIKQLSLAFMD